MKKRILGILICLIVVICSGCDGENTYQHAQEPEDKTFAEGYFTVLKEWYEGRIDYKIVYANDTKVKYFVIFSEKKADITPLYNTDGTLQIYEP